MQHTSHHHSHDHHHHDDDASSVSSDTPIAAYNRPPPANAAQAQNNGNNGFQIDEAIIENPMQILDVISNTKLGNIFVIIMKYGMRAFGYLLVLAALTLMSGVTYVWFTICVPMLSAPNTIDFFYVLHFFLGITVGFNVFFNYIMAIITPPGGMTQEWLNSVENQLDMEALRKEEASQKMWSKYCRRCKIPKAPRAHHCHICDKCVSRMDHHCPWVNNCVGYKNHRYFVLFLFYLWFACTYVTTLLLLITFNFISVGDAQIYYEWQSWLTFTMILCGSLGVTMTGFMGWHLYLVLTNQTTIEFQFNKMKYFTSTRKNETVINEYDLGMRLNMEQIFGPGGVFKWLMPTLTPPPLDGCTWPNAVAMKKTSM